MKNNHIVYFISCNDIFVKIGKCNKNRNPIKRLKQLQIGNPYELQLVGITKQHTEKQLHKKFKHFHHQDEWFHYSEEIKCFVNELKEDNTLVNKGFEERATINIAKEDFDILKSYCQSHAFSLHKWIVRVAMEYINKQ